VKHFASPEFWACPEKLPANVQHLARENYELLKSNPYHPSLHELPAVELEACGGKS
jgi:hypothetical protein